MDIATLGHALKPYLLVLLFPPVPMLILIGLSAALLRRHQRAGFAALVLGFAALWLSACEGSSQWLIRHLLDAPPALGPSSVVALRQESQRSGDVAVLVLGAGVRVYVPEYMGPGPRAFTLERLRYGVWLARKLDAPLGFTGGIGWNSRQQKLTEAAVIERTAREEFGLPLRWAEGRSRDTRENASLSLPLLKASGVRKLVLVTHVQHMPRALANFREAAQGANEMEIVAAPVGLALDGMSTVLDWCPSVHGFEGVHYALYEWLGSLAGH